MQGWLTDHF